MSLTELTESHIWCVSIFIDSSVKSSYTLFRLENFLIGFLDALPHKRALIRRRVRIDDRPLKVIVVLRPFMWAS